MYANAKSNKKKSQGLTLTWHLNRQLQYAKALLSVFSKAFTTDISHKAVNKTESCKKWREIDWK